MKRILITGGGGAGNEALHRLLGDRYETYFADADIRNIPPSISGDRRNALPFASDPGFAQAVAALCMRLGIDILVPAVDEELPLMDAVAALSPGLTILVPPPSFVVNSLDKLATAQVLAQHGIAVPSTAPIEAVNEVGFPCIVKPRSGRGSRGVSIVSSPSQLAAYRELSSQSADQLLAQELLSGQEYTVQMVATSAGRLEAVVPVLIDIKRGITVRARIDWDPAVIDACTRIHEAMGGAATYNIQLMKTEDGRILPFEINPRVSTTLCLSVAIGVDPFAIYLGARCRAATTTRLELRRYWMNEIAPLETNS